MKKTLIIGIILIIAILAIGGFLLIKGKSGSKNKDEARVTPEPTVVFPTVSEDIKVDLRTKNNKGVVVLSIKGITSDIVSIEYELTYTTGVGLPRGVLGKIKLKGEKEIVRDDIVLGTCSSGRCVYDKGVTSIDLALKFNTKSGSSVFQKTYLL